MYVAITPSYPPLIAYYCDAIAPCLVNTVKRVHVNTGLQTAKNGYEHTDATGKSLRLITRTAT